MKFSRLLVVISCLCLISCIYSGVVFGLDSNDASVTVTFSNETPTAGSVVIVTVSLTNLGSKQLEVYYFGIHFDWMQSDQFAGPDLSENPPIVPAGGTYSFSPVAIDIPSTVTVGNHSYFVGMDGYESNDVFSWDSPTEVLAIQDSWKGIFDDLVDEIAANITLAENADYSSPSAQSFVQQAQSSYSNALDYAEDQNYESAISSLQSAEIYLEQAQAEEETYVPAETEQDSTLIIVGVAIAAVVIIVVLLVLLRRKAKN